MSDLPRYRIWILVPLVILLISLTGIGASFGGESHAQGGYITFAYDHYSRAFVDESERVTLHGEGSEWMSIVPGGEVSVSDEKVRQMKEILTNRSRSVPASEYSASVRKMRDISKDDSLSAEEKKQRLQQIDDLAPEGIEVHRYNDVGRYRYEEWPSTDHERSVCQIVFWHNGSRYQVSSMADECNYDVWKVKAGGEAYVITSEKVTSIFPFYETR